MKMSDRAVRPVRKHLGHELRALREEAELSQARLGQLSGLSGKFIGEVERGLKSPSVDTLWRIARALKKAGARQPIMGALMLPV